MSLLNKANVRKYILERVGTHRPGWNASRVAAQVYGDLDRVLKNRINEGVHRHPSIGKTVKELK